MTHLKQLILLILISLLPVIASSQHVMDNSGLEAAEIKHSESLYHMTAKWANQNGETVQLDDFRGRPVMVVMFYGQCTGTCPVLIQRTWKLYSELGESARDRLQVLAVSFDYKKDTPKALKAYAESEQLDLPGWNFVTGQHSDIRELAMLLGVQYRERSDGHFEHSNLITVLDDEGKIAVRNEGITGELKSTATAIEEIFEAEVQ